MWTMPIRLTILLALGMGLLYWDVTSAWEHNHPGTLKKLWWHLYIVAIYYGPTVVVGAICGFALSRAWLRAGALAGAMFSTMIVVWSFWRRGGLIRMRSTVGEPTIG
jgi:hypothetical protein